MTAMQDMQILIRLSTERIYDICLEAFALRPEQVGSSCRTRDIVKCRFAIMFFTYHITGVTMDWIAAFSIPGRIYADHTTPLHAMQDIRDLVATRDPLYYPIIQQIASKLNYEL